ncbi:ubiquitin thiolesterase, putative peptidase C19, partial [Pseudoloma neurophilia]
PYTGTTSQKQHPYTNNQQAKLSEESPFPSEKQNRSFTVFDDSSSGSSKNIQSFAKPKNVTSIIRPFPTTLNSRTNSIKYEKSRIIMDSYSWIPKDALKALVKIRQDTIVPLNDLRGLPCLKNYGSNSFMNCALMTIFASDHFAKWFETIPKNDMTKLLIILQKIYTGQFAHDKIKGSHCRRFEKLVCCFDGILLFKELLEDLLEEMEKSKKFCRKFCENQRDYDMQTKGNASEFLILLLETIKHQLGTESEQFSTFPFSFDMTEVGSCKNCGCCIKKYEQPAVNIEIKESKKNLEQQINEKIIKMSKLSDQCPSTCHKQECNLESVECYMKSLPSVLLISIQTDRYKFTRNEYEIRPYKILLKMLIKGYSYHLKACIVHFPNRDHYMTIFVRNNIWYLVDDDGVGQINDIEQMLEENIYIKDLMYEKKSKSKR